jgi:hypothetical protein
MNMYRYRNDELKSRNGDSNRIESTARASLAQDSPPVWRHSVRSQLAERFGSILPPKLLEQTLNEAEGIAWGTQVPHLVLPLIAEEKLIEARRWWVRQQRVLDRSAVAFAA